MKESTRGRLYLAMAFILAGSSVVAIRHIAVFLQPFSITFISLCIAVAAACLLDGRDILRSILHGTFSLWLFLVMQAIFGIFLFRLFLTYGLKYTSASEAGVITGAIPATTALMTILILREPLTLHRFFGVASALAGLCVLNGIPFNIPDMSHFLGNALVLCAVVCEALFNVLARKMHLVSVKEGDSIGPVAQTGIVSAVAMVLCVLPMLAERQWPTFGQLPVSAWLGLGWYGSVITVAAFTCFFAGVKRCGGYTIFTFTGLMPLSSLVFSIVILHEKIAYHQWIGSAFILLSILIMRSADTQDTSA